MRVTQSMLTNNSLRYLSQSYRQLQVLQDQLSTQKKISRPSQDPVVAMNGLRYRTQLTEVEQFKRNLAEVYNWMESADSALDQSTEALHRIRELTVQVSNDTYEESQRANVAKEIQQLREHLEALANTKVNGKYIFNGTNTTNAPLDTSLFDVGLGVFAAAADGEYEPGEFTHVITHNSEQYELVEKNGDEMIFRSVQDGNKTIQVNLDGTGTAESITHSHSYVNAEGVTVTDTKDLAEREVVAFHRNAVSTNSEKVEIELLKGVTVPVNIDAGSVFSLTLFGDIIQLEKALQDPSTSAEELSAMIENFDRQVDTFVSERAELGARYNRVEMIDLRIQDQEVIAKRILSDNEDVDIEKVITELLTAENIHRAALSAMSRIMQPTLLDFIR
ncbi:flagellar hook-associated protein 3 FlgL [Evansella caseinilytica]|uniref:Flagellar hook-associated protein 3 FlgL n=1 Tax=Evansella caseinilytica TaxID=1503961 RepID=A0A1H3S6M0_9BACI|nr:flagellar hook-associated protein FlgL [Evansella caseinilytica]SDZ33397.1 flagellar hook-associated protein 3 FlgL [Evansella caseinilytica]